MQQIYVSINTLWITNILGRKVRPQPSPLNICKKRWKKVLISANLTFSQLFYFWLATILILATIHWTGSCLTSVTFHLHASTKAHSIDCNSKNQCPSGVDTQNVIVFVVQISLGMIIIGYSLEMDTIYGVHPCMQISRQLWSGLYKNFNL